MLYKSMFLYCVYLLPFIYINTGYSFSKLYCYQCVSTQPGCGSDSFNWLLYWSQRCPDDNDKCVKIIERKGATEIITRDCLSSVRAIRTDIPPDHYEGCRPAVHDVRLAQYVNNSIRELDVKRDHYDSVEWCFCFFDNRCNNSSHLFVSIPILASSFVLWLFL